MLALSSYDPERDSGTLLPALIELMGPGDLVSGLKVSTRLSELRAFVCFVWPDWPPELSNDLADKMKQFHQEHAELRPVQEGSTDWNAVFHGWCSDQVSAEAIVKAFHKNFRERLLWVESEKDPRGRIAATCRIKGLVAFTPFANNHPLSRIAGARRVEAPEELRLELAWKDSLAVPPGPLSDSDKQALAASTQEVFQWAAQRIRPILDTLYDRLKDLYGERFRGLYVFGSYARPDAGIELPEDSDLDVALLLSDFESGYKEIDRFGETTSDLSLEHGLVISLVPVREADFREGRTNFARVISEYAIPVK